MLHSWRKSRLVKWHTPYVISYQQNPTSDHVLNGICIVCLRTRLRWKPKHAYSPAANSPFYRNDDGCTASNNHKRDDDDDFFVYDLNTSTCWTVCASGWFSVGCCAPCHSMDGLFCTRSHNRKFPPIAWLCDASQMEIHSSLWSGNERVKKQEVAAAAGATATAVAKDLEEKISNAILQPGGTMRRFNHCSVLFTWRWLSGVASKIYVYVLYMCVRCVLNSTDWHSRVCVYRTKPNQSKPHQFMHTNRAIPKTKFTQHKYSVAIFSFHQFITDRAVLWMDLFRKLDIEIFLMFLVVGERISVVGFAVGAWVKCEWSMPIGENPRNFLG